MYVNNKLTIRSHFVPQFYLRNFGKKIYFYDKTTREIKESHPENLALKKNFYGPVSKDMSGTIESAMSDLEGKASAVIKKIIDTLEYSNLSEKEKHNFCSFVALQCLRTAETRIRTIQLYKKVFDEITKGLKINDVKIRYTKEGEIRAHLNLMGEFKPTATVLGKMGIRVWSNATEIPLWTSDNPVHLHNQYDQFPFGSLGILSKGIEVHVPLSPTVKVIFFDPITYKKEIVPEFVPMEESNVINSNYLQTLYSTRFMFSNTDKFFLVNEYLESSPESTNVNRTRMGTGIHELKPEDFEGKKFHEKPEFWMNPEEYARLRNNDPVWRRKTSYSQDYFKKLRKIKNTFSGIIQ